MNDWDGKDRRKHMSFEPDIRDKIIETHTDVKHLIKWSESHTKEDETRFEKINKDVDNGKKVVYGGIGGLMLLEFIMKFFK